MIVIKLMDSFPGREKKVIKGRIEKCAYTPGNNKPGFVSAHPDLVELS